VRTRRGLTGAQVAQAVLAEAGIDDVEIARTQSFLGDHYDPTHKRLCLSPGVHDSQSVAAVGIAAHECGHAIQHARNYVPLKARMAVVPVTMVASKMLPFIVLGGFFFGLFRYKPILDLGIAIYAVLTLFQLITLPVELDASRRAKAILTREGVVTMEESGGVAKVLNAAALTYVAAFLSSLFHLLHLLVLRGRN
ncbi:zinc metallopeptidase, partial [bacterium]|nr:zinc metallopeptidase [bacterium]